MEYLAVTNQAVDVRFGGTRGAPTLDGGARLRDAAATVPVFGITVEDVDIVVFAGENEKLVIAQRHIVPRQIEASGLQDGQIELSDNALKA